MTNYNKDIYANVITSDTILVGIPKINSESSAIVCNKKGLKNLSNQISRLKRNFVKVEEMANTPYSNFKILEFYNYKSTELVYIQDQRGIKIGIDLSFFQDILNELTIINGTIMNDCVWGTLNSRILLIPVDSEIYKICTENLERKISRISLKDIEFGDLCLMEDGSELIYFGYWAEYESSSWSNPLGCRKLSSKKKHIFKRTDQFSNHFKSINSPIVTKILKKNQIDTKGKSQLEYINEVGPEVYVPKVSKEYVPYLQPEDSYNFNTNTLYYVSHISVYENNSLINLKINKASNSWNPDYYIFYNNKRYNDINLLISSNDNLKAAIWYVKILDPQTKKEIELNITNKL